MSWRTNLSVKKLPWTSVQGPGNGKGFCPIQVKNFSQNNNRWYFDRVLDMARDFPHVSFRGFDIGPIPPFFKYVGLPDIRPRTVPIATRYPPSNAQFEVHDVNAGYRWDDGSIDLVYARSVSMAVSLVHP